MSETPEPTSYFANQVHGGVVVNERVRAIFQAIDNGMNGIVQSNSALKSMPERDFSNIKPIIENIKKNYKKKAWNHNTPMQRKEIEQEYSLDVANAIITYLDSIGQWWLKKNAVETSSISLYEPDTNK